MENQIKELGDKSERAKSEVGASAPHSPLTRNLISIQIVEIQAAHQAILQQQAGPSSLPAVKA
jgi:hypothetical protein